MNVTKSIYISSVGLLGHIFKDNEGIYAYQYNIAITWPIYKYIGGDILVSWLVLWETYVWLRLTENRLVLEVCYRFWK